MIRRAWWLVVACLLVFVALPRVARAQDVGDRTTPTNPPEIQAPHAGGSFSHWALGVPRPFLAATIEAGGIFVRPVLEAGWGKPHNAWGGATFETKLNLGGVTFYAGPRLTFSVIDLRAGLRTFSATDQHLVEIKDTYERHDLDRLGPPLSHYQSGDVEMSVNTPAPGGAAGLLVGASAIFGVAPNYYVFDDALRVVVDPPFVWHARFTYLATVRKERPMAVGGAVEVVGVPKRDANVLRFGPVVTLALTDHLQAIGAASFVVASPDDLGVAGDDIGQIALRYRWATGDRKPGFP